MDIRARKWITTLVTCALGIGLGPGLGARAEAKGSRKHAILFGAIGFGAGFGLGTWAGLGTYDDAINSERKIWTLTLVSAGVGTVIGYASGAHIDHKQAAARSLDDTADRAIEAGRSAIAVAEVAAAQCDTTTALASGDAGGPAPDDGDRVVVRVACAEESTSGVAVP